MKPTKPSEHNHKAWEREREREQRTGNREVREEREERRKNKLEDKRVVRRK